MEASKVLKSWRENKGVTQEAAALELGINALTLRAYEQGKRLLPLVTAARLADVIGKPLIKAAIADRMPPGWRAVEVGSAGDPE